MTTVEETPIDQTIDESLRPIHQTLQPKAAEEERRRRLPHYVYNPLRYFEFGYHTVNRKLSKKSLLVGRITGYETFYDPTRNRSKERFENVQENDHSNILPWPVTAWDQATEIQAAYGRTYGVRMLMSIRCQPIELAASFQKLLLTEEIRTWERLESIPLDLQLESLEHFAPNQIAILREEPEYAHEVSLVEACRLEIIDTIRAAAPLADKYLQEQVMEIAKARSGQKAKATYDDLDRALFKALGREMPPDMLTEALGMRKLEDPEAARWQERVRQIEAKLAAAEVSAHKPTTKECPDCYVAIPALAKVCAYCGYRYNPQVAVASPESPKATGKAKQPEPQA